MTSRRGGGTTPRGTGNGESSKTRKERALRIQGNEREAKRINDLARAAVDKVPFSVRFALLASAPTDASRPDVMEIAREDIRRHTKVLDALTKAKNPADLNQVAETNRLPRLRV